MIEVPTYDTTEAKEFFAKKVAFTTGPIEVSQEIEEGENINIVDVREPEDFQKGHVPGALNLPKSQWETMSCLRRDAMNIIYCYSQTCHLGAQAAMRFASEGFQVMEMDGGFETWAAKGLEIEK